MQRNLRKVFPRVCKTDFTQIAIAACSLPLAVRGVPLRTLTVFRTFLIQRQKLEVRDISTSQTKSIAPGTRWTSIV